MRPTTKDLARAAGVSLATVDRVLNGRAGVRQADGRRRQRGDRADRLRAEPLGGEPGEAAQPTGSCSCCRATATSSSRRWSSGIEEAREVFAGEFIEVRYLRASSARIRIRLRKCCRAIDLGTHDGVALMAPESPQVRDATTAVARPGCPGGAVRFGPPRRGRFRRASTTCAAGATAGRLLGRFVGGRSRRDPGDSRNAERARQPRTSPRIRPRDGPRLRQPHHAPLVETHGDGERTRAVIRRAYTNHHGILGAYVLSSEARLALQAIAEVSDLRAQTIVAHERTRFSETLLINGQLDAVIAQNPGHLVRSALRVLRARCDNREPIASQEDIRIEILLRENLGSQSSG